MAIAEVRNNSLHKVPAPPKELHPVAPIKQETFQEVLDRNSINIGTTDFDKPHNDYQGGAISPTPGEDIEGAELGPPYEEGGSINPNPWEEGDAIDDGSEPPDPYFPLERAEDYVAEFLKTSSIPPSFYEGFESSVPQLAESMEEMMDFTVEDALSSDLPWTEHEGTGLSQASSEDLHYGETKEDPASSFSSAVMNELLDNDQFVQTFLSGQYGWKIGDQANFIGDLIGSYALAGPESGVIPDGHDSPQGDVIAASMTIGLENWSAKMREMMDGYTGEYAPFYWDNLGFLPGDPDGFPLHPLLESPEDVAYQWTPEGMVDLYQNEDWETIYGPFLTRIGVSLEDWMDEWGQYLIDYSHKPAQDIRETAANQKNALMAQMAPVMEQYRTSSAKTGFQDHYSTNIELANLMASYTDASNQLDQQAWEEEQQYYDEFMADWTSNVMDLTQLGAFNICNYNPEWAMCDGWELGDEIDHDYQGGFCEDNPEHPLCLDPNDFYEDYEEDDGTGDQTDECMDPSNYFIDQFGQCHGPCCANQGDEGYSGAYPELQPDTDQFPPTFTDENLANSFENIWYSEWTLPESDVLNFLVDGQPINEEAWNAMPSAGAPGWADDGPGVETSCVGCGNNPQAVWSSLVNCCPGTFEECYYNNNCN
tara:strand:+ start:490 stop:2442 length:1953 start_codon:yes stop_codon:yes gene_type:complete